MTNTEQFNQERLLTSIQKCRTHLVRIHYASKQIKELFPMTPDKYKNITEANIGNIDQLVFRFPNFRMKLETIHSGFYLSF